MQAYPRTRYTRASRQTWELIRAAYLSGLSGPTVCARFGVSVTALRKRARREGWTKTAWAAARDGGVGPLAARADDGNPARIAASPSSFAPPPGGGPFPGCDRDSEAMIAAIAGPLDIQPSSLARRALANAAGAVRAGRGGQALQLARAAEAIARLDEHLPLAAEADDEAAADARLAALRRFIREQALSVARALAAGDPPPPGYEDLMEPENA